MSVRPAVTRGSKGPDRGSLDPVQIAARSRQIGVVTDEGGRILFWNRAAAAAFGIPANRAQGEVFPEVVQGRDLFGNRLLHESDRFRALVQQGEPVRSFAFEARTRDGRALRLAASVLVVLGPESERYRLVYLLRRMESRRKTDLVARRLERELGPPGPPVASARDAAPPARRRALTRRQAEVLESFAEGRSVGEVAAELGISRNTVRNHAQAILERLGVRSRAEAVALAVRRRLIR